MNKLSFSIPHKIRHFKLNVIKKMAKIFTLNRKKYENMNEYIEIKQEFIQEILNDFPRIWMFKVIEPFLLWTLFTKPTIRFIIVVLTPFVLLKMFWWVLGML